MLEISQRSEFRLTLVTQTKYLIQFISEKTLSLNIRLQWSRQFGHPYPIG